MPRQPNTLKVFTGTFLIVFVIMFFVMGLHQGCESGGEGSNHPVKPPKGMGSDTVKVDSLATDTIKK